MKIVVFGGSFHPPHLGHWQMMLELLRRKFSYHGEDILADEIWLLPVGQHSFGKSLSAKVQRLELLTLFLKDFQQAFPQYAARLRMESYEIDRGEMSYTADTLRALRQQYPEHQFFFLIGSDNLANFHLWSDREGQDFHHLLAEFPVLVYPRLGYPFVPLYENMWPLADFPSVEISSTEIRQRLARGEDCQQFVSPSVLRYSKQESLFLVEKGS